MIGSIRQVKQRGKVKPGPVCCQLVGLIMRKLVDMLPIVKRRAVA